MIELIFPSVMILSIKLLLSFSSNSFLTFVVDFMLLFLADLVYVIFTIQAEGMSETRIKASGDIPEDEE